MGIIIAVTNQKGGVGKTTTTINVADALKNFGFNVLTIDFDPSCNATTTFGAKLEDVYTLYDVLDNACPTKEAIQSTPIGDIIPGDALLAESVDHFSAKMSRELLLKKKVKEVVNDYDYIIIDTPPTLNLYMLNALAAANGCVIPLNADHYSIDGLKLLFGTINQIRENEINENLKVYGTVITKYDARTNIDEELKEGLPQIGEQSGFNTFNNVIRVCQEVKKAQNINATPDDPNPNRSLYVNFPKCKAAIDYVNFTKELVEVANG